MGSNISEDIQLTHSILNYLFASVQGRFSALNILSQLEYVGFNPQEIELTRGVIEQINGWLANLWKCECLFSASAMTADSFEAKKVLDLLGAMKSEESDVAISLAEIMQTPDLANDREAVKYLIASFGRFAYERNNYIKGFIDYGKNFNLPELMQSSNQHLPESDEDVRLAHAYLNAYKNPDNLDARFYDELFYQARNLPFVFRTHVHDINQLLAKFSGGITWTSMEFGNTESQAWGKAGFGPTQAGYWRSYGFAADEAATWLQAQFSAPAIAAEWRDWEFPPNIAAGWAQKEFPPPLARRWFDAQFGPEQALSMVQRGIMDPEQILKD